MCAMSLSCGFVNEAFSAGNYGIAEFVYSSDPWPWMSVTYIRTDDAVDLVLDVTRLHNHSTSQGCTAFGAAQPRRGAIERKGQAF